MFCWCYFQRHIFYRIYCSSVTFCFFIRGRGSNLRKSGHGIEDLPSSFGFSSLRLCLGRSRLSCIVSIRCNSSYRRSNLRKGEYLEFLDFWIITELSGILFLFLVGQVKGMEMLYQYQAAWLVGWYSPWLFGDYFLFYKLENWEVRREKKLS